MQFTITGKLVNTQEKKIYTAAIIVVNGKITAITPVEDKDAAQQYILPGFIDSHVHIESSMLVPRQFARLAVVHGTVATVSDPHEIANVCGMKGVEYMIENGKTVPFKFFFGAPSCVPATTFETAGATLDTAEVATLLQKEEIHYLSEMMNFPGVLYNDPVVMDKIWAARRAGKPIDGHAPGLRGDQARQYIEAGEPGNVIISTDHECFTREEALDKLEYGMRIIIREGSAARNFEALIDLLNDYPEDIMFGSDDKHPDSLVAGHINQLCARAVAKGIDVFKVLQAACVTPVLHYNLPVGLLRVGDAADFIVASDLQQFNVLQTFINGELVAEHGTSNIASQTSTHINNFNCSAKTVADFQLPWKGETNIPVIEALDGQLITNKGMLSPKIIDGQMVSDTDRDILKIAVVNRYSNAVVALAFIKNTGLKQGAIASSVAHDSHNIVAVGVDDESLCEAVNLVIAQQGGVSCVGPQGSQVLPLPVAGLMSAADGYEVARSYTAIDAMAKSQGSTLSAPFMTLSFMALLVIPHLKLSDLGLFDGDAFKLFEKEKI
ncbi:adenine deaminase [Niastella koreensis]|uniref:Adenine deaminase n=2 Tax=Niastella koreensis TaxID=354356 RepID=G8TQJ7_NIAKG|nr:adenine deaminase [Niastella koreensis]AEW03244.1 Adenine deaminase [Niastella koreensis GR20-10]OQP55540.1 adenine deaminase [Niastella koreensis]